MSAGRTGACWNVLLLHDNRAAGEPEAAPSVQSSRWYAAVGHALGMEERRLGDGYPRTSGQYKWVSWLANELEEARLKD